MKVHELLSKLEDLTETNVDVGMYEVIQQDCDYYETELISISIENHTRKVILSCNEK